jgi:hypothetical protein
MRSLVDFSFFRWYKNSTKLDSLVTQSNPLMAARFKRDLPPTPTKNHKKRHPQNDKHIPIQKTKSGLVVGQQDKLPE